MNCFSCNKYDHITINCPLIRHVPNKSAIIKRYVVQNTQNRQTFKRKNKIKFDPLFQKSILDSKIKNFQDKNIALLENYEKSNFWIF